MQGASGYIRIVTFRGKKLTVWGSRCRILGIGLGVRRLRLVQDFGLGFWGGWGLDVWNFRRGLWPFSARVLYLVTSSQTTTISWS